MEPPGCGSRDEASTMHRALTSPAAIKMFSISASRLKRRTEHNHVTVEPPPTAASQQMFLDINELLPTSTLIYTSADKPGVFLLRREIEMCT